MIVGLDLGTGRAKAVAVDRRAQILATATRPCPPVELGPDGAATQDLDALVAAAEGALAEVLAAGRCEAVALTTQRGTTAWVDASGEGVGPLISWLDGRGDRLATLPPDEADRVVEHRSIAAHLAARWLGEARDTAPTAGPRVRGLAGATLWPIGTAFESSGRGLIPAGVPVVMAGGDKGCELLALGATAPGRLAGSLGTAVSIGTLVPEGAPRVLGVYRSTSPVAGSDGAEVGVPAGGALLSRALATARPALPPPGTRVRLPFDRGSLFHPVGAPALTEPDPSLPAAVVAGLILEGVILELMRGVEALASLTSIEGPVTLGGGGAREPVPRWLADALDRPVRRAADRPHGALGAAAVAAAAIGWAPSLSAAVARIAPPIVAEARPDRAGAARWRARRAAFDALVRDAGA